MKLNQKMEFIVVPPKTHLSVEIQNKNVTMSFGKKMKIKEIACPQCNTSGMCEVVPRLSHVNVLVFLAGGFVLSLLWSGSRPTSLKCAACEHRFSQRTQGARAAFIIFWILTGIIVLGVLAWVMDPE